MRKDFAIAIATVVLAVVLGGQSTATAGTIVKCVGPGGSTTYQSTPCGPGQQTADSWAAAAPPSAERAAEIKAQQRQRKADAAYLRQLARRSRGRAGRTSTKPAIDACQSARRARAAARRDAHLDYDARDKLDNAVMQACY